MKSFRHILVWWYFEDNFEKFGYLDCFSIYFWQFLDTFWKTAGPLLGKSTNINLFLQQETGANNALYAFPTPFPSHKRCALLGRRMSYYVRQEIECRAHLLPCSALYGDGM